MPDELETILRLVAEGHLTPEEAAPIIEAIGGASRQSGRRTARDAVGGLDAVRERVDDARRRVEALRGELRGGRQVRVRVTERGRQVVNLRIPLGFADLALRHVPGLGEEHASRIKEAIESGAMGPLLDVEDEDGSGVVISVE